MPRKIIGGKIIRDEGESDEDYLAAAGEGVAAIVREDREMRLIERHDRRLGYVRAPGERETEEQHLARLKRFGIDPE